MALNQSQSFQNKAGPLKLTPKNGGIQWHLMSQSFQNKAGPLKTGTIVSEICRGKLFESQSFQNKAGPLKTSYSPSFTGDVSPIVAILSKQGRSPKAQLADTRCKWELMMSQSFQNKAGPLKYRKAKMGI